MTTLLQHGVSAQAEANPEATALVFKGDRTIYRDLEETSNRIAHALLESGCQRQDRVAILMPKIPMAIAAMLGILKAGAAYVPLDPAEAPERLALTLCAADCHGVLAAGPVGPLLQDVLARADLPKAPRIGWLDEQLPGGSELAVDFALHDLEAASPALPGIDCDDEQIAHILFTSGSTGTPKGVMIRHRNVLHFIRWASSHFRLHSNDRISQHPPLRFDVSTFDVFGALWAGAELHLVPEELNLLPHKLASFIRESRLTQWFSVPSVMNLMAKFDVIAPQDFPRLRRVLFAGEVLPTPTLIHWMKRLPQVQFTNLYGPTETTISSSYFDVPGCPADERKAIPIGKACDGEELVLLDTDMRPIVRPDVVGDLYVRGAGVTAGYWRDAEKTSKAFLGYNGDTIYKTGDRAHQDANGLFYFVGRADSQIKSRGYRIEPGEIESALNSLAELREAVVVPVRSGGFEGTSICCAYTVAPGTHSTAKALRKKLARKLPSYMLPAQWTEYEFLPRNTNGKYDRRKISDDFIRHVREKRTGNEAQIASTG